MTTPRAGRKLPGGRGNVKAVSKLLGELVAWRWAPAVALCFASLFYVLLVVTLVPDEIGVPVTNARFAKRLATKPDKSEAPSIPAAAQENDSAPAPPVPAAPVQNAGVVNNFGRRGFSPPLERPEPPPPPPPPPPVVTPPPAPPPVAAVPPAPEAPPATDPAGTPPPADGQADQQQPPAAPPGVVSHNPSGIMRSVQALRGLPFVPRNIPPAPAAPPEAPPGEAPPAPSAPPVE
jgi:hypothetical protein